MAQSKDVVGGDRPLNILIIGGSLAGLMAGIRLRRKGHNIKILEQAESSEREGMAAGIGLPMHVKKFFETEDRLSDQPMGLLNKGFSVLDDDLNVKYELGVSLTLTSWDAAYYRARANFDGLQSVYCPEPPKLNVDGTEGSAEFLTGRKVVDVGDVDGTMTVTAENTKTGGLEKFVGDLVIAADGANSSIRRQLFPKLKREEPGYVIWRGTIPTKDLSQDVLDRIENKPIIWAGPQTYCVIYTIPGENGSLAPGTRHINFAWYFWPSQFSVQEIMTDKDGHFHRTTIPKGKIRPEIWQPQIELARKLLPKELSALVERIQKPFVSLISSITAPKAAVFDNRLFLVGDALTQTQPNVGMGTNLAANAVEKLVNEVICPPPGQKRLTKERVSEWEYRVLQENEITRCRSMAFGSWYLNSWPKIGWYYARFYALLYWQQWFGGRATRFVVFNNSS